MSTSQTVFECFTDNPAAEKASATFSKQARCDLRNKAITLWRKVESGSIDDWKILAQDETDGGSINRVELLGPGQTEMIIIKFEPNMDLRITTANFVRLNSNRKRAGKILTFEVDTSDPGPDGFRTINCLHNITLGDSLIGYTEGPASQPIYDGLSNYMDGVLAQARPDVEASVFQSSLVTSGIGRQATASERQ